MGLKGPRDEFRRELQAHALPLLRELGRVAAQRAQGSPEVVAAERFPFWTPPLDQVRASRLLDYLIFDYRPASYGQSVAQEYLAQRGPLVTSAWRELLAGWSNESMRLFVLEQQSGGFLRCRAALPEASPLIEVMPLEANSLKIKDGSAIALRALPVASRFVYASWPVTFGERTAEDVRRAIVARHHTFVRSERIVRLDEFLVLCATVFDEEAASSRASQIILPGRA